MKDQYLNPDFLAGRPTGTCCWGCAKKDDCPMESLGRRCTRDHTTCPVCTWWNERGCILFQIDWSFLKM
ncbi:hypothetical protein Mpal_1533 [Methanosphaerula palustris E1-9c]|uniref:Uncharacterized protein n=1 Tax=Methanosphaerula palustris (strain ATCC BAA-1556 / DSM 19958 / E1-9c) TaxID=521011 RepID=B8GIN3_METPE|nr:hypothetical protein Mpal_1533 [Methanosphaerula palustris E1-9c]